MKLNLGCGSDLRYTEGWLNADINLPEDVFMSKDIDVYLTDTEGVIGLMASPYEEALFTLQDITEGWKWKDEAFTHILMDNVLEHIPLQYHTHVFQEAWRTLRPGGTWRIIVPQGKRLRQSWDHVVPPSMLGKDRLRWITKKPYHPDAVKQGYPFNLRCLGASRSLLRRAREWWNWFQKSDLEVVYEKVEG